MYPLTKFQPHMPINFGITALQSSNNRKIDLYSKHRENKLQVLTKAVVTDLTLQHVQQCIVMYTGTQCVDKISHRWVSTVTHKCTWVCIIYTQTYSIQVPQSTHNINIQCCLLCSSTFSLSLKSSRIIVHDCSFETENTLVDIRQCLCINSHIQGNI